MEEMDLKEFIGYFFKSIPIIFIITSLTIMLGEFYSNYVKVPLYKGDTTLILVKDNENSTEASVTQNDIMLNQKLVSTYSEIIKSRLVLKQVINKLNLSYSVEDLSKMIKVSSVKDTEIIKISVSNEDNELAVKIANTIAEVFELEIKSIYNIENISIIDEAKLNTKPYNMNIVKETIIYTGVGIILGMAFSFVIYYFDTTIKTSDEIERKLNLPVLGVIPKDDGKYKKNKKRRKNK